MGKHATVAWMVLVFVLCVTTVLSQADRLKCPSQGGSIEHGSQTEFLEPHQVIHYVCHPGYFMVGEVKQTCGADGQWVPAQRPECLAKVEKGTYCKIDPPLMYAKVRLDNDRMYAVAGDTATVVCTPGYHTVDNKEIFHIICGNTGIWTMPDGSPVVQCNEKQCPVPPNVPNAVFRYTFYTSATVTNVQRVEYLCMDGFVLVDSAQYYLTCNDGEWEGPVPTCVRSMSCPPPRDIYSGAWKVKTGQKDGDMYAVGTEVQYTCQVGYKLIGSQTLECTSSRQWSKVAPVCLPSTEKNWYCPELHKINNGYCRCEDEQSNSLDQCQPYYRGIQVQCFCNSGYKLQGSALLTCTGLGPHDEGAWDHEVPYCLRDGVEDIDPSFEDERSDQGLHITAEGRTHVSTLVIVIATACSVLGVLLLIMVIVVFRRKKPRPRLFHPSVTPPPYSRVHNNVLDEHDRLALMAYADATRVHLPTYEEAVQAGRSTPTAPPPRSNTTTPSSDFRPLPSIPATLRAPSGVASAGADNPNRHSTVTTSTINRDGVSENFGSLDTVNVSMSDASTSVTVETFDSGTSTRSITSQRATAGSLTSSDDNLANDNAPLLDSSSGYCEEDSRDCPTPNQDQKEE
ncbi:sushi, von Willebrand factor type A, EGF and pentraxin domain-containing protein 1-like isoform X1 [Pomacea canaliculata]|nr:sushi, von Willebrand factor type A, EGF and pentraxin domain-containing protein 1-like isoform X1 [Pomacea canaliculata]